MQDFPLQIETLVRCAVCKIICLQPRRLERLRSKVSAHDAMQLIATGLGDDLHDTAGRLAVLGFKSAGLHLNFFYKRQVDAGGQRTE